MADKLTLETASSELNEDDEPLLSIGVDELNGDLRMSLYIHIKRLDIKRPFFSPVTRFMFISHFLDLHEEHEKKEKIAIFIITNFQISCPFLLPKSNFCEKPLHLEDTLNLAM